MLEIPNISINAHTHDNSEVVRLIKVNLEQAKITMDETKKISRSVDNWDDVKQIRYNSYKEAITWITTFLTSVENQFIELEKPLEGLGDAI